MPDRTSVLRAIALSVQVLLAAPLVLLLALALLALVMLATGTSGDPHGFATAFTLVIGAVVAGPAALYVWFIRRWWQSGTWRLLALTDLALAGVGVLGMVKAPHPTSLALIAVAGIATASVVAVSLAERRSQPA